MIGQTVSHYKILEKLGEGGMGVVYKALDTNLDRPVALKFLPLSVSASEQDKARFVQEAKAAAVLNHPNICTIHGIEEYDARQFIVMEFVDGESLKSKIKRTGFTVEEITEIATRIAEGLKAAHENGVVHRDVKSENIILTRDGKVKIMDFGLAKLAGGMDLTRNGSTVGTIAYMSPEQIQALDIDHRADLWSFGVVLYEMIARKVPFQAEHEAAIIYEILNVEPIALQSIRNDVPEKLQILISQALQKDRSKRIGSASEIIEQLRQSTVPSGTPVKENSIAVLYFENMSSEKESDYFCAGITEDIITDLSKIKEVKVVSRSDVQSFRNKDVNTRLVGETLRVNYILEGSVRKSANKIRITAQLIDIKSGFHVWAERYDRLVDDILDLQDDIAQSIVKALKISLTESEKQSLGKRPTDDIRAYDLYMRGRELLYRRGRKNSEAAIQMFEHATALDPNFTASYGALAEAYSYMFSWYDGSQRWLTKTIEVSQKAIALDPQSVEALFGIGIVYFHQKRYGESKQTLKRVIEKNADYYDAYRWLGILSDIDKEYDAALRNYEQCARLKPYSEEPWMHIDMTYRRMGNEPASENAKRKLIEVAERKLAVNPDDTIVLSRIAGPQAQFGEREKALASLNRILQIDPTDGLAQYNCACTYSVLGEKKQALESLKNAITSGYKNVREWVKSDPDLLPLHDEPEFKTLISEIG